MPMIVDNARKLAGMALARIVGVKDAAKTIGVDPRSIASWLEANADADQDEQAWLAAEQLAQERLLTGLAKGDSKSIAGWATAAGIASRNRRYARLIARREQRRTDQTEGGQTDPATEEQAAIHAAVQALSEEVTHWMHAYTTQMDQLDKIRKHVGVAPIAATDEDGGPTLLEWLQMAKDSTPEMRQAATDERICEAVELTKGWKIVHKGSAGYPRHDVLDANGDLFTVSGTSTPAEFAHLPIEDEYVAPCATRTGPDGS